jgi:hypothetical protein
MVFNATFNNISVVAVSFIVGRKHISPERNSNSLKKALIIDIIHSIFKLINK